MQAPHPAAQPAVFRHHLGNCSTQDLPLQSHSPICTVASVKSFLRFCKIAFSRMELCLGLSPAWSPARTFSGPPRTFSFELPGSMRFCIRLGEGHRYLLLLLHPRRLCRRHHGVWTRYAWGAGWTLRFLPSDFLGCTMSWCDCLIAWVLLVGFWSAGEVPMRVGSWWVCKVACGWWGDRYAVGYRG